MPKTSAIERNKKRKRLVEKYKVKRAELKALLANPKTTDVEFFAAAKSIRWEWARLAAFGSTRHRANRPEADPNLRELVAAETPVVTIFGKSWLLHVTEVLGATRHFPGNQAGGVRRSLAGPLKTNLAAACLNQNIGEDGQCGARTDDILNALQAIEDFFF